MLGRQQRLFDYDNDDNARLYILILSIIIRQNVSKPVYMSNFIEKLEANINDVGLDTIIDDLLDAMDRYVFEFLTLDIIKPGFNGHGQPMQVLEDLFIRRRKEPMEWLIEQWGYEPNR
jgi:hypothetical protein